MYTPSIAYDLKIYFAMQFFSVPKWTYGKVKKELNPKDIPM